MWTYLWNNFTFWIILIIIFHAILQAPVESKKKSELGNALLVTDFRQRDGSLFEYNLQAVDDKVMGGHSESNIVLDEVLFGFQFYVCVGCKTLWKLSYRRHFVSFHR